MNSISHELRDVKILVMTELQPVKDIEQGNKLLAALVGLVKGRINSPTLLCKMLNNILSVSLQMGVRGNEDPSSRHER